MPSVGPGRLGDVVNGNADPGQDAAASLVHALVLGLSDHRHVDLPGLCGELEEFYAADVEIYQNAL
jgi:hypothetical protein